MSNIVERIFEIAKVKKISAGDLSIALGLFRTYFYQQRKRTSSKGNNVSSHMLVKIIDMYPDINIEWLLTGRGSMLKDTSVATTAPFLCPLCQVKDATIEAQETIIKAYKEITIANETMKDNSSNSHLLNNSPTDR